MARQKDVTLFNKNNIKIIRHTDLPKTSIHTPYVKQEFILSSSGGEFKRDRRFYTKYETKEITLESPLGFYYTKKIQVIEDSGDTTTNKTICVWNFWLDQKTKISISYITKFGDTGINVETRPWEIADNTAFEDHLVTDLRKVVDDIINEFRRFKIINIISKNVEITNLGDIKRKIYTDLFGYPEGPKFQTNEEKILSHGFDPKTSFRK